MVWRWLLFCVPKSRADVAMVLLAAMLFGVLAVLWLARSESIIPGVPSPAVTSTPTSKV